MPLRISLELAGRRHRQRQYEAAVGREISAAERPVLPARPRFIAVGRPLARFYEAGLSRCSTTIEAQAGDNWVIAGTLQDADGNWLDVTNAVLGAIRSRWEVAGHRRRRHHHHP